MTRAKRQIVTRGVLAVHAPGLSGGVLAELPVSRGNLPTNQVRAIMRVGRVIESIVSHQRDNSAGIKAESSENRSPCWGRKKEETTTE